MGGAGSKDADAKTPSPIEDLECLGRCASSGNLPGEREKAAFERFRAREARLLSPGELRDVISAVEATEFPAWQMPPEKPVDPGAVASRVRGCLFGAALGDACGLATEFLTRAKAEQFYGADFDYRPGCDVYPDTHRGFFPSGDWTDDTDQMILILQSLLSSGGVADSKDFAVRLKQWAAGGFPELGDRCGSGLGKTVGKVVGTKEFEESPEAIAEQVWRRNGCSLAANGAVMRAAVCGLPSYKSPEVVEECAVAFCKVTHFDSRCVASCVCVAMIVSLLLAGLPPADAEQRAVERARTYLTPEHEEDFAWHVAPERTIEELELDEPKTIGYTFKALACGLWALRSQASFQETIQEVTRRGGDADTNAVVCGALLGCARGYDALPAPWLAAMPYSGWLEAWTCHAIKALGLRGAVSTSTV